MPAVHRYNVAILVITYIVPMLCMGATYTRVGVLLWGSQRIGERTQAQSDSLKAKRKVSCFQQKLKYSNPYCPVVIA